MTYGTSKVTTEFLALGEKYKNLKKVYSINIVYFDLGQGKDYVYHGKTDFIGVHKSDKLLLSAKQSEIFGKTEPSEILPEYYVIKVNNFDDVAKDKLDQWIYYFKNNEIRDDFTAQGMDKARELWRVDNLSEDDHKKYLKHLDNLHYHASMEWTLKVEAEDKIKKQRDKEIAKGMIKKGLETELIKELTGLNENEIKGLYTKPST